jgi:hypothetical protein
MRNDIKFKNFVIILFEFFSRSQLRKRFPKLAGLRFPTFLCEFLIIFEDLFFFKTVSYRSLVGLQNGAMLLLGGQIYGWIYGWISQTEIWQLKEYQWSRIGELNLVLNII